MFWHVCFFIVFLIKYFQHFGEKGGGLCANLKVHPLVPWNLVLLTVILNEPKVLDTDHLFLFVMVH